MRRTATLALLVAACLALGPAPAQAGRTLLTEELLETSPGASGPPAGQVEGACGLAVSTGDLYVSDYYHRAVDVFSSGGVYRSQIELPGSNSVFGINTLDAVCGLALGSGGDLYANEWHQGVLRLRPGEQVFDEAESTGVAVDAAGDVYVNDRTYVAVYEPSGEPVLHEGQPLRIGSGGTLHDAYGVGVSASGARVYVADAADDKVKVFEPATSLGVPVQAIDPGFVSLTDAALAVDPTDEHLLVVDNVQPGFEHPKATIDEFDSTGAFLGRLPGTPVDGEPSGIAVDSGSGKLYVTSGNDEEANVFAYGPYASAPFGGAAPLVGVSSEPLSGAAFQTLSVEPGLAAVDGGAGRPGLAVGGRGASRHRHRALSHRRRPHHGAKRRRGRG
jgi:DNA-binding beta-propeller fold protein YncE